MKTLIIGIGAIVVLVAILALNVWVFQFMWNFLVPVAFGGVTLTFWQSAAFLVLTYMIGAGLGLRHTTTVKK